MPWTDYGHDRVVLAQIGSTMPDNTATQRLGPIYNDGFKAMRFCLEREGQNGAAITLDAQLQWKHHPNSAAFQPMVDHAGAAINFEQWLTTETGLKIIDVGLGLVGASATDLILADAGAGLQSRYYNAFVPMELYVLITQTQAVGKWNIYNLCVEGNR